MFKISEVDLRYIVTIQNYSITVNSTQEIRNVNYFNFNKELNKYNIPIISLDNVTDFNKIEVLFQEKKIDIALVIGWYNKIPNEMVLKYPFFAIHASLLPAYSGWSPLTWSLINGEKKTGVTFFKMNEYIDAGPIVAQKEIKIKKKENINTLYIKALEVTKNILSTYLPKIANQNFPLSMQDTGRRTVFPARKPEDGKVKFSKNSLDIVRFARAQLTPLPGAFIAHNQYKFILIKVKSVGLHLPGETGQIYFISKRALIKCGKGEVLLKEISFENRIYKTKEISKLFKKLKLVKFEIF